MIELQNTGLDPLTGINNRATFINRLDKTIENKVPSALFMIDIVNFREINNKNGQIIGDEFLISLAVSQPFFSDISSRHAILTPCLS